jgi:hypothetical protein
MDVHDPRRPRPAPRAQPLAFQLPDRLAIVVTNAIDDEVIVGVFFDGQLARMTEEAVGEA